jgi:hypothetical protein
MKLQGLFGRNFSGEEVEELACRRRPGRCERGLLAVVLIKEGDLAGAAATAVGLALGAPRTPRSSRGPASPPGRAHPRARVRLHLGSVLAAYLDGIRSLSVRRFTLAVIAGLHDRRLASLDASLSAAIGAAGAVIALVAFTALAIRRLTTMDVP